MKYNALTLDTQAFATNSYDLDGGWLAQVKQFRDAPVQVVISSVVARELRRQLADKIRSARDKFEAATKKVAFYGLVAEPSEGLKLLDGPPETIATSRIKSYLAGTGATLVPVKLISVEQLMTRYFKAEPPFATSGTKKAEFPDAVALMTLEAWARTESRHILAVSADGDWASFARTSLYIDVVPTVKEALALLQEHADEARELAAALLTEIARNGSAAATDFQARLDLEVSDASVDPVIETSQHAEVEGGAGLVLNGFCLAGEAPDFDFSVVRWSASTLVVSLDLRLSVRAAAYIHFYGWDSVDKESIPIGGFLAERDVDDLEASVIVTWTMDLLDEAWSLVSVELVLIADPDFGYVGMDWSDQDWDEPEEKSIEQGAS